MTAPGSRFTVPPSRQRAIRDGGRWFLVWHDGDEEATIRTDPDESFRLGYTSGTWVVANSASRPLTHLEIEPDA